MEVTMSDKSVESILDRCSSAWRDVGIDETAVSDMRTELESHLREAAAAGKNAETVVGPDVLAFANAWAASKLGPEAVQLRSAADRGRALSGSHGSTGRLMTVVGAIVGVAVLAVLFGRTDDTSNQDAWTWSYFVAAGVLAVGEIFTAAFFLLPFAIGAAIAGVLALIGVHPWALLAVFAISSGFGLWGLQRWAQRDADEQHPVGANRIVGMRAVVTESIERRHGVGRVRMETEDWRATTDLDAAIEPGTEVLVTEVRGTRLVVVPLP